MKKLINIEDIHVGERFVLSEKWHEKLESFAEAFFPYDFSIVEIVKKSRTRYFICQGNLNKKTIRIALTEYIGRYLFSKDIPDTNEGFLFKEYLPEEESKLLITNMRNPSEVIPAILHVDLKLQEINSESMNTFTFKIDYLNGKGFCNVKNFTEGPKKGTWKFLLHEDESYMTEYEKMFRETIIHKEYFLKSADIMVHYLEKVGAINHAEELKKRALVHDNSKISCIDELNALSRIVDDKSTFKDPRSQLPPAKREAIMLHYEHNSHHPEHYKSPIDMSKADVLEMCCDWHARSCQYGTDFLSYVKEAQEIRFHFPEWMFAEIWHFCNILSDSY